MIGYHDAITGKIQSGWAVRCRCGWRLDGFKSQRFARAAGDQHLAEKNAATQKLEHLGTTVQVWRSPVNGHTTIQIDTEPGVLVNVDLHEGRLFEGEPDRAPSINEALVDAVSTHDYPAVVDLLSAITVCEDEGGPDHA